MHFVITLDGIPEEVAQHCSVTLSSPDMQSHVPPPPYHPPYGNERLCADCTRDETAAKVAVERLGTMEIASGFVVYFSHGLIQSYLCRGPKTLCMEFVMAASIFVGTYVGAVMAPFIYYFFMNRCPASNADEESGYKLRQEPDRQHRTPPSVIALVGTLGYLMGSTVLWPYENQIAVSSGRSGQN
ncbi:hypothetical protein MPH_01178 [Macrophomina phaseolina MS6]|uniref:Uncharacterized protein n=1 Tax=Macrophomina phaseolina (strain MS6) TaxID=1126212 RepID=K2S999_MACPH|nr:hypothetical protein MPH_01178 [Macrophomina phaseolina MS6]